ncbi:MAG: hypothetical protein R2791_01890 [Saprospiraceae bacterium]
MENSQKRNRNILYWLAIFAAVAVALYVIADRWFPQLVSKFTSLIAGAFLVVTGLFLRKKKRS